MYTIKRAYEKLGELLKPGKVLVVYGPRQTGKTTLIENFIETHQFPGKIRYDSGENIRIREVFETPDFKRLLEYAQGNDLIVIDEAQKITKVGEGLKIIVDQVPEIRIIATGSSSFDLAGQLGEPLTGRKRTVTLYPISQLELSRMFTPFELRERLDDYLIYGGYPEVVVTENREDKRELLDELVDSYLLKDILELDRMKSSKIILDLLRLLAFQIGNEVSFNELSNSLGIDGKTVARYLDILEKSFVLYNLRGYSRNLRSEVTKKSKYYFWDTGIRNAIISNFNPPPLRNDMGCLWENFIIMERLKKQSYQRIHANNFFWRAWQQHEVDFVEERGGRIYGFEFKWGGRKRKVPKAWLQTYPEATYEIIGKDNYLEFVL
jgi:uncharacterized protein